MMGIEYPRAGDCSGAHKQKLAIRAKPGRNGVKLRACLDFIFLVPILAVRLILAKYRGNVPHPSISIRKFSARISAFMMVKQLQDSGME
jgi:hypothetical protein